MLALHPHNGLKSSGILYFPRNLTLKITLDAHFSTIAVAIASRNCSRQSPIPHLTTADGVPEARAPPAMASFGGRSAATRKHLRVLLPFTCDSLVRTRVPSPSRHVLSHR
jgi:hypothetical protein